MPSPDTKMIKQRADKTISNGGCIVVLGLMILLFSMVIQSSCRDNPKDAAETFSSEWSEAQSGDLVEFPDGAIYIVDTVNDPDILVWKIVDHQRTYENISKDMDVKLIKNGDSDYPTKMLKFIE